MKARFDNLPMDRKGSAMGRSPLTDQPAVYERREIDPDTEIVSRRLGSERQARYAQALGLSAEPAGSQWAIDAKFDLTGSWSIGFSADVGDVTESAGEWTLVFVGATTLTSTNASIRCYLKYTGSTYNVHLDLIDNSVGPTTFSVTPVPVPAGSNVDILITSDATDVTLSVDALTPQSVDISSGTFGPLSSAQIELLGTHKITTRAKGNPPVMDNFQAWASVVTTDEYQARTPSVSAFYSIQPSDLGGYCFSPATGGSSRGKTFAVPAPPCLNDSKLHFTGFGGALLVPFRQIFERYFQTQTENVGSRKFSFKVEGRRYFRSASTTLLDFGSDVEGLAYLELDATGKAVFTYNGVSATSVAAITTNTDFSIVCGVDGTNVYMILDGVTPVMATMPAFAPYLDWERIPDMYIGSDEDPALAKNFHGYLTKFQFYDYAVYADSSATLNPSFDLDVSASYLRDKSKNRIALAAITHDTTEGHPGYALGPITDQDFVGVESGIVTGAGALGYTGIYKEPIGTDLSSIRVGDRAFVHSGNSVHVFNSELNQVRPLGLPEPEADVSVQSLSSGALDGVYDYGYRWISQDGTRGPVKRLKPVKATGAASVLIGAGDAAGSEERRELGESYGLAESDTLSASTVEHFSMTDSTDGIAVTDADGVTVETYLRFPDFSELEESVFDRGSKPNFSDKTTFCVEPDNPIDLNPNADWTMQLAFRADFTETGGETHRHQGLLAIGHEDPGPTTRSVMAYLDVNSTFSSGTARLVFARSLGLKDNRYRYLIFNSSADEGDDTGFWDDSSDYNLTVVRDGDDLRIHAHDVTTDTWLHLTGGACVGFFAGYDFPHKKIDFRATNVAFRKTGSSGNHWEGIADLPTAGSGTAYTDSAGSGGTHGYIDYGTGASNRGVNRLGWMDSDSYIYHARAWSRAWPQATIQYESHKRFVATPGEPMDNLVQSDIGFFSEDHTDNPNKFYDRVSGQYWRSYKEDSSSSGVKNPTKGTMTQIKGTPTEFTGVAITDDTVGAETDAQYRVYASSLGDGSIIVTTGKASYTLPTRLWDGTASASYTKPLSDLKIDPQQFNWFTTTILLTDDGTTDFDLTIRDLDVNGNRIFDAPLGANDTAIDVSANSIKVYMGGMAAANTGSTHIGEFRWWNKNRYDDASEQYDFLTGRVKGSEWADLYFYATFEPADLVTATTYNHRGTLSTDLLTLVNTASIYDTRDANTSGGATDPAPAIGIPDPPYDHITAIELFRTATYPVTDPDDDGEVQKALKAARGLPLYKLARIPAGDSSYVDVSPDEALGAESPQAGTGQMPDAPNGIGIWQNQLLTWRGNEIHFAEPSIFGWESFPSWLVYPVPVPKNGSDILAVTEVADNLLVSGASWTVLLVGSPSAPRVIDLGAGAGVQAVDCLVTHGGLAFGLGTKKLWVYKEGQLDESFSTPVHEMLPTNGRLAISGNLSSLFVIDQSSDQVLRYHFPTGSWSVEERDAQDIGDYAGTTAIVHTAGSYSTTSATVFADDVTTSTAKSAVGTIATISTVLMAADPSAPVGSRVYVVDSTGLGVSTRVVSFT